MAHNIVREVGIISKGLILDSFVLELRRGTIVLGVLSLLHKPQYGYSLVTLLKEKDLPVEAGTLYPLLRRLEEQGMLESIWDVESAKPRKYYSLSSFGKEVYTRLCAQWYSLTENINTLIDEGK